VTTEANEYQPLDAAVLKKLRALQREGAPDILRTLLLLFLENGKTMLGNLEHAASAGDCEGLHRAGHALTSGAANIGAKALASRCKELARQARVGSITDLSAQVAAIVLEFQRVEAALVLHLVEQTDAPERVPAFGQ
jgi:two-component system, sensor histidine kinase and response regulator